ncbi:hypothetical protein MKX01_000825 [Papaver californicum]|nr:hypothetical protein MKX01_000825 [Papaver californicum]
MMKVAPKVIIIFRDDKGFGSAIFEAIQPNPNSPLEKKKTSLEISLQNCEIKDCKFQLISPTSLITKDRISNPYRAETYVLFELLFFFFQISVLLLQNYKTPVIACVVSEILALIRGQDSSSYPTIILPFFVPTAKLSSEVTNSTFNSKKVTLYCTQIGTVTDFTQAMLAGVEKSSSSLQIYYEPLACLLHSVRILKLPAVLLIGPRSGHQIKKTIREELEVLYEMGEHLASKTGLCFSKDQVNWSPTEKTKESQEPWRAL